MQYAEVAVNVPIRRSFSVQHQTPPPDSELELQTVPDPEMEGTSITVHFPNIAPLNKSSASTSAKPKRGLQTFHYHLPAALEKSVQPGHLVWVPFGRQEIQGIVVRLSQHAPVETRAIASLARPEPVLTQLQLELASWIAETYIASFAEALKLFLPPGLLTKNRGDKSRVRAKRELQIALVADDSEFTDRLLSIGKKNQQTQILFWLIEHNGSHFTVSEVMAGCALRSMSPLTGLVQKGLIRLQQDPSGLKRESRVFLHQSIAETKQMLVQMCGVAKYVPILEALQEADRPLWKSELYARVDADLAMLRALQSAGLVRLTEAVKYRDPLAGRLYAQTTAPSLTDDQEGVWRQIASIAYPAEPFDDSPGTDRLPDGQAELAQGGSATSSPEITTPARTFSLRAGRMLDSPKFLLHGVTGSGKTEIFLRAISATLRAGKEAIVLVPEIALTPQTVARFAGRFPGLVTVIHSGLSQGERFDVWRRVKAGEFPIVVGPRSALFAPLRNLGLIIIDEEHESSYKQSAEAWGSFTIFYDARAVAHRLADMTGSTLIMGSATPSMESYFAAQDQDAGHGLTLLEMPRRVLGHSNEGATLYAELPPVEIVDMRQELRAGNRSILSRNLQAELHATLDRGEQAILFLNRRGTRTFVLCRDCGHVMQCNRCDVPLTYHDRAEVLICHHCNRRNPIPTHCPECDSKRIKYFGSGTQRLEELVSEIAPRARILRWDADTTARRGSHEEILRQFANHEADVIVGTQMIAKGLDLPLVTLVGVVAADSALYLPDFRSAERTFQLLTQVAGRAGRSERGGRVILQTYTPDHYAIQAAAQHDFQTFYQREICFRREHGYPPLQRLLRLVYWDKKLEKAESAALEMAQNLRHRLTAQGLGDATHHVLGPAPAFFPRFRGYYRWQILIKSPQPAGLLGDMPIPFGWRVDVDPISLL